MFETGQYILIKNTWGSMFLIKGEKYLIEDVQHCEIEDCPMLTLAGEIEGAFGMIEPGTVEDWYPGPEGECFEFVTK